MPLKSALATIKDNVELDPSAGPAYKIDNFESALLSVFAVDDFLFYFDADQDLTDSGASVDRVSGKHAAIVSNAPVVAAIGGRDALSMSTSPQSALQWTGADLVDLSGLVHGYTMIAVFKQTDAVHSPAIIGTNGQYFAHHLDPSHNYIVKHGGGAGGNTRTSTTTLSDDDHIVISTYRPDIGEAAGTIKAWVDGVAIAFNAPTTIPAPAGAITGVGINYAPAVGLIGLIKTGLVIITSKIIDSNSDADVAARAALFAALGDWYSIDIL